MGSACGPAREEPAITRERGMTARIALICRWLTHLSGYMLLTAGDEALAAEPAERFARAWRSLIAVSLVWGVASAGLYGVAWAVFGEYTGIQLMPVAAVLAMWVLWFARRMVAALGRELAGGDPGEQAAAVAVIVVVLALALLGLKSWQPDWQVGWLRVPRTMFRVLILAPLWGAWSMFVAALFCRATRHTEPSVAAFIGGCGPLTASALMAVLLAAREILIGIL